jgi:glycosyltransferase involved in cell wall biosynthesis
MRILQVIPFFSPQMGGSSQAAYHISRNLGVRGHSVTVLAGDYSLGRARFPDGPFELVALPSRFNAWGFYVTPAMPSWVRKNISRFDVVHLHISRTFQNIILRSLAAEFRVPCVVTAHGTLPRIDRLRTVKWIYDRLFGQALYREAKRWIAVTPLEADQFRTQGIPGDRIRVIGYGLDLEEFNHLPPPGSFRRTIPGLKPETKLFLSMSRLHKIKGLDFLIEGFARLPRTGDPYRLIIVGPDEGELDRLRSLARRLNVADAVLFAGPLYGPDRLKAFVDADLFISTSRYEITGLTSFEALMCGTPILVTRECGLGTLIEESGAGYVVPFGAADTFADSIRDILADSREASRRVRAGQEYVRERMDWRRKTDELIGVYREILPESSRPGSNDGTALAGHIRKRREAAGRKRDGRIR